jgi:formate dehydrogenase major subunit
MPYHWGTVGRVRGDSTNDLLAFVGDPNVYIMESKALTANIVPGRVATARRAATRGSQRHLGGGMARDLAGVRPAGKQPGQPVPRME